MRGCIPESFGGHYRVTVDPQVLLIGGNGGRSRRCWSVYGERGGKKKKN
jgi:hypothetical protein